MRRWVEPSRIGTKTRDLVQYDNAASWVARHVTHAVKFALLSASLLLLTSCGRDTTLRDEIVGTWTRETTNTTTGRDLYQVRLAADGSFNSEWILTSGSFSTQGTWKVQDGVVVSTITNCIGTTNLHWIGSVARCVIVRLGPSDLVWSMDGQTVSLARK